MKSSACVGRLDEICRDDGETVTVKYRNAERAGRAQAAGLCCSAPSSASMWNFSCKLPLPLLGEVWRAEHSKPTYLATVEKFPGNEGCLDGLANAHIVGDEQAHWVELERHHQRHELIRTRFGSDTTEAAERAGRRTRRQAGRIPQEPARCKVAKIVFARAVGNVADSTASTAGRMPATSSSSPPTGRTRSSSSVDSGSTTHSRPRALNQGTWFGERPSDHGSEVSQRCPDDFMNNRSPVFLVVKADHDVARFHQPLR